MATTGQGQYQTPEVNSVGLDWTQSYQMDGLQSPFTGNNPDASNDQNIPNGTGRSPADFGAKSQTSPPQTSPLASQGSDKMGIIRQLLSSSGHLSHDSASGRLRYFGPTTTYHLYPGIPGPVTGYTHLDTNRRVDRILRDISQKLHDYLMDLYWTCYNDVLYTVDKEAFYKDMEMGETTYSSGFLHMCILGIGYRFGDQSMPAMKEVTVGNRESTFHRGAKYLLESELEKPGGLTTIQALLLLGDLECGVGRDKNGWLYAGMAYRLAFDMGLNLDCSTLGLSTEEAYMRRMVFWACIVSDQSWALFLGRATAIKPSDVAVARLPDSPGWSPTRNDLKNQAHEALLELMGLATKTFQSVNAKQDPADPSSYMAMASLDRELHAWYQALPLQLRWTAENLDGAPFCLYRLHQQFHCTLMLLHRPFAQFSEMISETQKQINEDEGLRLNEEQAIAEIEQLAPFKLLSRAACHSSAIQVAKIFAAHAERFKTAQISISSIQHASTAAVALVASISLMHESTERKESLSHLSTLVLALRAMSPTFEPAERTIHVLDRVLSDAGWDLAQPVPEPAPTPMEIAKPVNPIEVFDFDPTAWAGVGPSGSPLFMVDHTDMMDFLQASPGAMLNAFGPDVLPG